MPMNPVPSNAPRLPMPQATVIDTFTGSQYIWTTVTGVAIPGIQVVAGMGYGLPQYTVAYQCPRCDSHYTLSSTEPSCPSPGYPMTCSCDFTLVFGVAWTS